MPDTNVASVDDESSRVYYRGSQELCTTEFDIVREREAFAYGHRQTIFIMVGDDSLLRVAMARRLQRFLNWRGADVMRFPVIDDELDSDDSVRQYVGGIVQWLDSGGVVGILDGRNGDENKRLMLSQAFRAYGSNAGLVYLECSVGGSPAQQAFHIPDIKDRPTRLKLPPGATKATSRVFARFSRFRAGNKRAGGFAGFSALKKAHSLDSGIRAERTARRDSRDLDSSDDDSDDAKADALIRASKTSVKRQNSAVSPADQKRRHGRSERRARRAVAYQPIPLTSPYSYIKLYSEGNKVMISSIFGRLTKSLLPFLMASSRTRRRPVWLVRAACVRGWDNAGDLGGRGAQISRAGMPSPVMEISKKGRVFARWLGRFINDKTRGLPLAVSGDLPRLSDGTARRAKRQRIKIMVSTLKRAGETAANVTEFGDVEAYPELNPLDKGVFVGAKFRDSHSAVSPAFYERWEKDRYKTRWPGGESYSDVRVRVENVLIEIEQQAAPVLVVAHGTVLQVLKCYFSGQNIERCWQVNFPHNTVVEFNPVEEEGGWSTRTYSMADSSDPSGVSPPSPSRSRNSARRRADGLVRGVGGVGGMWGAFVAVTAVAGTMLALKYWFSRRSLAKRSDTANES